jgi:drug/metabolite transporter (DMT)-like permease
VTGSGRNIDAASLAVVAVMALVWGCNWPMLKIGVSEMQPLTFRLYNLPFIGLGMLLIARLQGDGLAIPRALWPRVLLMALFNITAWNGFVLFGVQQMSAGRSAILAYTMPVWSVLLSVWWLKEPLDTRRKIGLGLGMAAMVLLLGDDLRAIERSPTGALLILAAAISWAFGTIMVRKWRGDLPQNTLIGWMLLLGWVPIALLAPMLDPDPVGSLFRLSFVGWTALLYNIFLAGLVSHWAWFRLARTLPVAVSSLSSLPVPVVGVISGMLVLGERPGVAELGALALVALALIALYWPKREDAGTAP